MTQTQIATFASHMVHEIQDAQNVKPEELNALSNEIARKVLCAYFKKDNQKFFKRGFGKTNTQIAAAQAAYQVLALAFSPEEPTESSMVTSITDALRTPMHTDASQKAEVGTITVPNVQSVSAVVASAAPANPL
jgi:hypothetical protein